MQGAEGEEEGGGKREGPGRETAHRGGRQGWEAGVEGGGRWKGRGQGGRGKEIGRASCRERVSSKV